MASKKISELTAAGALSGVELVEVVKGGVNVQTTTQDIADLGGGGGGSGDVVGPASATDSVPVLFDGTTGKLVKDSTPTGTGNPVLQTGPTLTNPVVGTQSPGDNSTLAASTAYADAAVAAASTLGSVSTSTAGATITLNMDSNIQRIHVGSATFATAKAVDMTNVSGSLSFQFIFEVTSVAAVLTLPSDWLMTTLDFDGADWTPPATGKYVFGGSWNGTNWFVNAAGPYI